MERIEIIELMKRFLALQNAYSFEKRVLVTSDKYRDLIVSGLVAKDDFDNPIIKETLMEHVGHLPILTAFFYPYFERKDELDLGKVFTMLAIHDIGETETGDVFSYDKQEDHTKEEYEVAMRILPKEFKPLYEEFEACETLEAQCAQSMDKLAPDIHEIDMPYGTMERFYSRGFTVEDVIRTKRPLHEWDPIVVQVFDLCMEQFKRARDGEELIFDAADYDMHDHV